MIKKLVLAVLILGLCGGGFFYWWTSQADVRELNKTLPEGVRVTKSLFGGGYKVINKIDGYSFKVPINPKSWNQMGKIEYRSFMNDDLWYGAYLSEEIKKFIKSENILSVTNPNNLNIVEISSLHFNSSLVFDNFVEDFQVAFAPARGAKTSSKTLEIVPQVDDLSRNNLKILKISEVSKYSRDKEDIKEDVSPIAYLVNDDPTVIHIVPLGLNDYLIDKVIFDGKW